MSAVGIGAGPPRARGAALAVLVLMSVAALFLWIGIPTAWLWLTSQLADRYQTAYALTLVGGPLTMALWAWGIYRLNRTYVRLTGGGGAPARRGAAWLRSVGAARRGREPRAAVDMIMAASVLVAVVAWLVWFFAFAGSSLTPLG